MQDMATLEAYINPLASNVQNAVGWWKKAFEPEDPEAEPLSKGEMDRVLEQVAEWRERGFLRKLTHFLHSLCRDLDLSYVDRLRVMIGRDHDVLVEKLPKRTDIDIFVMLSDKELEVYRPTESSLTKLFKR